MDHTAFEDYVEGTICQSVIVIILVNELSFDNVGLIISPDMIYDSERARTDKSLNGLKTYYSKEEQPIVADRIIKNTYRVLMTRGMKGCFVYCVDKAMADHLRDHVNRGGV